MPAQYYKSNGDGRAASISAAAPPPLLPRCLSAAKKPCRRALSNSATPHTTHTWKGRRARQAELYLLPALRRACGPTTLPHHSRPPGPAGTDGKLVGYIPAAHITHARALHRTPLLRFLRHPHLATRFPFLHSVCGSPAPPLKLWRTAAATRTTTDLAYSMTVYFGLV